MSNLKELHNNIDLKKYNSMKEINDPIERYILNNNKFQPNEGRRVIKYTITKIPIDEENVVKNFNNDAYRTGFEKYVLNNPNGIHIDDNGEESKIKTTYIWRDSQSANDVNKIIPISVDKEQIVGRDISRIQSMSQKEEQKNQDMSITTQGKQWESNEDIKNLFKFAEIRKTHEPAIFTETELLSTLNSATGGSQKKLDTSSVTSYLANENSQGRNNSKIYVDYVIDNQRTHEFYPWNKVMLESKANQLNLKGNYKDNNILQQEVVYGQPTSYITPYEMAKLYDSRSKMKNDLLYKIDLQQEENNERLLNPSTDTQSMSRLGFEERNNQDTSIISQTKHWEPKENINNLLKLSETRTMQGREPVYTQTELLNDLKTAPDRSQKITTTPTAKSYLANENRQGQNNLKIYENYVIYNQSTRESYPWNKVILESKANQNLKDNNIIQQEVAPGPPKGYIAPYEMAKLYESRSKMNNDRVYKIDLQQEENNGSLFNPNTDDLIRNKTDTQSLQNVQSILTLNSPAKELILSNDELLSNDNTHTKKIYETDSIVQSNDILKLKPIHRNWKDSPNYNKSEFYTKTPFEHQDEDDAEHIMNENGYKQYLKIYLNQVFSNVAVTIDYIQKLLNLDETYLYNILQEYAQLSISIFDVLAEIDKYYSLINHRSHQNSLAILKKYKIDDYKHDNGNKATEHLVNLVKKYESMNLEVNRDPKQVFDDNIYTSRRNEIYTQSPTNKHSNLQFKTFQLKEQNVPILRDNIDIKNKYETDIIHQSNDALKLKQIYEKWMLSNYSKPTDINYKTTLEFRDEHDDDQKLNRIAFKKYLNIFLSKVFLKVSLTIDFIQKLLSLDALNLNEILKEYAHMSITMFNALEKIDTYYSLINHCSHQDFLAILRTNIIEDHKKEINDKTAENIVNLIKKYNSQIPKVKNHPEFVTYLETSNKKDPLLNVNTHNSNRDGLVTNSSLDLESDIKNDNQPSASKRMPYVIEIFKQELEKEPKNDLRFKEKNEHLLYNSTDIIKNNETDNLPQSINDILKRYDKKQKNLPNYNKSNEFNDKIPSDEHKLNNNDLDILFQIKENMQHSKDINYKSNNSNENIFNDKMNYLNKLYLKMYLNKELTALKKRIELMQKLLSRYMMNLYDILDEYTQIPTTMLDLLTEIDKYHRIKNDIANQDIIEDYKLDNDDINIESIVNLMGKDVSKPNLFPFNLKDSFVSYNSNLGNSNCNREEAADVIMKYSLNLANQLSSIGCFKKN
ncbi:protein PFF0380w-like [Vanessa atalanta]|uniref:protein PFF0380w-like n=1 Tax=Vanessa atalanta TaxID=42275 RepID=UPI001FCCEA92|nr:protein PFF0380w-like [Vanessa atalanta]